MSKKWKVFLTEEFQWINIEGIRLPWWLRDKESTCQCRRHRFDPWSRKISHAGEQLGLCTTVIAPILWSLGAATTESTRYNSWSPHTRAHAPQEKPLQQEALALQLECSPCSPQLEKSLCSNKDPAQPKINFRNVFLKNRMNRELENQH